MSINDLERERIERSIALLSKASPRPLSDLIPYERNQKNHDERQIANVANSLRRFGWRQPIVVDARNVIVIGHCRVLAAKQLGLDSAPCIDAADLSEDEIRELRIADNKTNESAWNDYLNTDIQELDFDGFDFDFDDGETGGVRTYPTFRKTRHPIHRKSQRPNQATFGCADRTASCAAMRSWRTMCLRCLMVKWPRWWSPIRLITWVMRAAAERTTASQTHCQRPSARGRFPAVHHQRAGQLLSVSPGERIAVLLLQGAGHRRFSDGSS